MTGERKRSIGRHLISVGAVPRSPRCGRRAATIAVSSVLGLALLTGCAKDAPQDTWQPAGENAQKIQNLQWPVFLIAGIVMLLVFAAVGWAVFRYRDRGQPIPEQSHGKPALEIALTILPALILIGVAIPTVGTLMALSKTDDTECYVNVTGQQWWWEIDYPTQEGCGGITEPIVTSGQMIIPTGTNVLVRGTSRDVIHSWWIPRLNGKRDMVPGRVQTVRLEADQPGIYAGQCTEFCGLSHANMRMEVVALDDGRLRGLEGQPAGRVRAAGGRHAGRHGRADVHRPVLAVPPGRRSRSTPTATRSSPSPSCTSGPRRRRT